MRNFIVVFLCLVSWTCLGQVNNKALNEKMLVYQKNALVPTGELQKIKLIGRPQLTKKASEDSLKNQFIYENQNYRLDLDAKGSYDKELTLTYKSVIFNRNRELSELFNTNDGRKTKYLNLLKEVFFFDVIFKEMSNDFSYIDFKKKASFIDCEFEGEVFVDGSFFQGNADFKQSIFHKEVDFDNAYFQEWAYFENATFEEKVSFYNTKFNYLANFENVKGKGKLFFENTEMPNILNFQNVNSLKIDFRNASIDSLQKRVFPVFPRMKDNFTTANDSSSSKEYFQLFEQSISLDKCVIQLKGTNLDNIILPHDRFWIDVIGYTYEEKTALFEKLIKKCKEEGMDDSVIGWSTELKKIENLHNFPKIGSFLNWFQGIFWNYGFTKSLILLWILGAFLLFNLLNFFIYAKLINVYFNPKLGLKLIPKPLVQDEGAVIGILKKNRFTRLRYMLHYTGMIFFGIKLEHTDMSFKHLGWVFLLYFEFVIGIVLLGFALNFVVSK
jgi:uncharacterized protein YjbI with pentapeptide repeats